MIKAKFNEDGFPAAFYDTNAYDDCSFIPNDAVVITEDQWKEFLNNAGRKKWVDGKIVDYTLPAPPLAEIKKQLKQQVDMAAENERLKYITAGVGQSMTYQEKYNQAVDYSKKYIAHKQAPDELPEPNENDYLLLKASLGIDGDTLIEVAETITYSYAIWQQIGAAIEATRLESKAAIENAETAEEAQAVFASIKWPCPSQVQQ
ncbi:MAG: hypothetical protein [Caudoviricetes sp.]|nr:MAG: hypothetical protein [Caudoviricetes sp.]